MKQMCHLVKSGKFGAKSVGVTGEMLSEVLKTEGTLGKCGEFCWKIRNRMVKRGELW